MLQNAIVKKLDKVFLDYSSNHRGLFIDTNKHPYSAVIRSHILFLSKLTISCFKETTQKESALHLWLKTCPCSSLPPNISFLISSHLRVFFRTRRRTRGLLPAQQFCPCQVVYDSVVAVFVGFTRSVFSLSTARWALAWA